MTVVANTPPTAPTVIQPVDQEEIRDTSYDIEWQASSDADQSEGELRYEVDYSANASDPEPAWVSIVTLAMRKSILCWQDEPG